MKAKILGLVTMFVLATVMVFAGNVSKEIKVKGNCDNCKDRIEEAAKSVEGVTKAEWDKETKVLALNFDDSQTSLDEVEKAIAKVGHDTPNYKAEDEVYNKLPDGCKYREVEEKEE